MTSSVSFVDCCSVVVEEEIALCLRRIGKAKPKAGLQFTRNSSNDIKLRRRLAMDVAMVVVAMVQRYVVHKIRPFSFKVS